MGMPGFTKEQHTFKGDGEFKSYLAADTNCGFNSLCLLRCG